MNFELVAILMFTSMFVMLLTGRHIFAVIGSAWPALSLWSCGGKVARDWRSTQASTC